MINEFHSLYRRRLFIGTCNCRLIPVPSWRIQARAPTVHPRAARADAVASPRGSSSSSSNNTPAAAPAAALLHWACSGWPGPQYDDGDGDDDTTKPIAAAATAAAAGREKRLGLRVVVRDLGPGRGRGLIAAADLAPGETLLSVPLTRVFTSQSDSELHWSAEMALRLLRARHLSLAVAATAASGPAMISAPAAAAAAAAAGASPIRMNSPSRESASQQQGECGGDVNPAAAPVAPVAVAAAKETAAAAGRDEPDAGPELLGEAGWGPWIAALPTAVRTPLEYDDEEIRQLGCPYVMEEVRVMQQCVRDCYEVLRPDLAELGCGWRDFLWAVQVFHSRCFYEPGSRLHMCVPGVDLANHSPRPSAEVRLQHSPAACQGYEALAEVAEPPPPEPSRFNLLAGEGGIRCGDEVTISYGCWPSEGFLLLFGFVPTVSIASTSSSSSSSSSTTTTTTTTTTTNNNCENADCLHPEGNSGSNTSICPGEILTLFGDAEEAVRWSLAAAAAAEPVDDKQQQQLQLAGSDEAKKVEAILRDVEALMPGEAFYNLAITSEGVDGRLQVVLQAASQHLGLNPRDFLRRRVQERLAQFENVDGNSFDGAIGCFVRSKRALAQCILTQL